MDVADSLRVQKEPTRRTTVAPKDLLGQLVEVLKSDCKIALVQDRDHYIAQLQDARNGTVMVQNTTAELAMMDVLGKWKRNHVVQ